MKDIKYNSDLSEDIYNLNNNNVSHISLLSIQDFTFIHYMGQSLQREWEFRLLR